MGLLRVLPYVELPSIGPIQPFGMFVLLGLIFATIVGARHAERLGLDLERARAGCSRTARSA